MIRKVSFKDTFALEFAKSRWAGRGIRIERNMKGYAWLVSIETDRRKDINDMMKDALDVA